MRSSQRPFIVAAMSLALLAGCGPVAGRRAGAAQGTSTRVVADRLFLGRSIPGGGVVSEADWDRFVAEVVAPRFPNGFTVWRAQGQWRDEAGQTIAEDVLVLEILHPPTRGSDAAVAEIAEQYRLRFEQDAVLRSRSAAQMEFFD